MAEQCGLASFIKLSRWVFVLEKIRKGQRNLLWVFPVTIIPWVNMHGGFVAGFGLLAIYATGELLNKRSPVWVLKILGLTIPFTMVNPYGIEYLIYIFEAVTMPRPDISEWRPFDLSGSFHLFLGFKLLFIVTLSGWGYRLTLKERKPDWVAILLSWWLPLPWPSNISGTRSFL